MPTLPEDKLVRGQVYLCQTGPCVSCGSCCGLYNMADLSREHLRAILAERTNTFAGVPRTIDDILAFEQERMRVEGADAPIADFHHCFFVGLIQDGGERVGCLLHPLASGNGGLIGGASAFTAGRPANTSSAQAMTSLRRGSSASRARCLRIGTNTD